VRFKVLAWVLGAAGCCAVPAASQTVTPAPPAHDEPSIEPDRPDVTNGTHIVGVGLVQIEAGGTFGRPVPGQRTFSSPVTARIGVLEWLELRVGTDGLLMQSDRNTRISGIGNLQAGAKLRLWADESGAPVLSILPTVNLPTASVAKGFGSGDPDYTIVLLTGTDLGPRAHVDVNYGIGAIGAGRRSAHFVQHLVSASASVSAARGWDPYFEAFWFSRQDPDAGASSAIDFGTIYTMTRRVAIDGGVEFGTSHAAPDVQVFAGVTLVLGEMAGGHGEHARQRKPDKRSSSDARRHR
jgi:hypothetical protein